MVAHHGKQQQLKSDKHPARIRIGPALEELLKRLPSQGPLFPKIENVNVFRSLPSEFVVNYFSDKMKDYLENFIKKGHSGIKWG